MVRAGMDSDIAFPASTGQEILTGYAMTDSSRIACYKRCEDLRRTLGEPSHRLKDLILQSLILHLHGIFPGGDAIVTGLR